MDDRRNVAASVCGMIVLFLSWRGYSFYDENGSTAFFEDLTSGLMDTISAGWTHPAFGVCCLMPIFLFTIIGLVIFRAEETAHKSDKQ